MRILASLVLVATISFGVAENASADIIAAFENDDLAVSSAFASADTVHSAVSSSTLTFTGLAGGAGWPNALTGIQNNSGINSLATAISNGHFFSLTITPDSATSVSYADVFLRYSLQSNDFPATTQFSLLSSLTGFTASDLLDSFSGTASVSGLNTGSNSFDVSGVAALQSVAGGIPAEFRVYVHNTGPGTMTRIGIGQAFATNGTADLQINGTTLDSAVPEPSSLLLLGLAVSSGICIRFCRMKNRPEATH